MSRDPRIEQAMALIEAVIEDAYQRGRADALREILAAATESIKAAPIRPEFKKVSSVTAPMTLSEMFKQGERPDAQLSKNERFLREFDRATDVEGERKRAPRGSAERVIKRAMEDDVVGAGVTVQEIMRYRRDELEMMLAESSIRGELRRGQKADPPKYVEDDGRWREAPQKDAAPE